MFNSRLMGLVLSFYCHLVCYFARLVCVTEQNLSAARDWLTAAIAEIAPEYGYKNKPSQVPKRMFLRILEAKQVKCQALSP